MKKIIILALALVASVSAYAEGYQVNTLSARQLALGHTGVSQKLGSESMYFNPAGLGFLDKTLEIAAGMTATMPTATATITNSTGKTKYTSDNGVSTPLFAHIGFRVFDKFKAGVSFYVPYGSSINWTNSWPGAVLIQKVDLKTYALQPTISYKILPNLSVGAGLVISWGSVNMDKGLIPGASMDLYMKQMLGQPYPFGDTPPASVNISGKSNVTVGYNIGAMYEINKYVTVGASFRSKMTATVKAGNAKVSYVNEQFQQMLESKVGLVNNAQFTASLPMPYTLTLGASVRPTKKVELSFDAQFTGWGTYKSLDIEFLNPALAGFNQHSEKNYKNVWAFRLGCAWKATKRFELLAGLCYDMAPADFTHYSPETPAQDKISPSLGFSFRPISKLAINFSCAYVHGLGVNDAKAPYIDMLLQKPAEFSADYRARAWCPSIGLTFSL